ncbi:MAG: rod shape-determining protein [Ruminococcaceae bacterium]|nr:rod shape-determining protein [Oscillospiraceae bacterium]
MAQDIGIDLGTSSVLVYVKNKGVVVEEPAVVVVDKNTGKVMTVGKDAARMLGRTPAGLVAINPMRDGVIDHYDMTLQMLKYFIKKAIGNTFFKPRVIVCVPSGITEVEERAVCEAALRAGAKKVHLIEEPLAAAIGAGLDISKPIGNMVIDIGGGTTDIAVMSLGDVVASESIKVAGNRLNESIVKYIRRKHSMLIGDLTAEELKIGMGTAWPFSEPKSCEIKGRCLIEGLPKKVTVTTKELLEAMDEPLTQIVDAVCRVIEMTPPELVGDIATGGIVLTGGGSKLRGMDKLIEKATGIKVHIPENPVNCVCIGAGRSLDNIALLPEGVLNISRSKAKI